MNSKSIYVIGDVHGCYKTLLALVKKLPKNAKICFVGDLIDRGKDSSKVLKFIRKNRYDSVLGNHEYFMIEAAPNIVKNINKISDYKWTQKAGGIETLKSYSQKSQILDDVEYLKSLPLYIEYKDIKTKDGRYLVVSHSSVENKWKYKDYEKDTKEYKKFQETLLFSRYKNYDNKDIFNIYGHTPTTEAIIKNFRAQIDLGCCYQKESGLNPRLCAIEFPSMKIITQENIE